MFLEIVPISALHQMENFGFLHGRIWRVGERDAHLAMAAILSSSICGEVVRETCTREHDDIPGAPPHRLFNENFVTLGG